jgi:hypothetical protein
VHTDFFVLGVGSHGLGLFISAIKMKAVLKRYCLPESFFQVLKKDNPDVTHESRLTS